MGIRITTDSTCDLGQELLERYQIPVVPLHVNIGGESLRDGVDCSSEQIFSHTAATGQLCSTAAVSVGEFSEFFSSVLQDCDALIHISISSVLSSTYQNGVVAAEDFPGRVYVLDSLSLTAGMGLLVLDGVELAGEYTDAAALYEELLRRREKISVSFVVDTLEYLHKGGRCSALAALGANLLKLRPCIESVDGALTVGKKYRGTPAKALSAYLSDRLAEADSLDRRRAFVGHAFHNDALLEKLVQQVKDSGVFEEVHVIRTGAVISCHSGPEVFGLLYLKK